MKTYTLCCCFLFIMPCFSQNTYDSLINKATMFYVSKDYKKSGLLFSEAFVFNGLKSSNTDRYNAACAWSLAKMNDSAFAQLFFIASHNFVSLKMTLADEDLTNLHHDKRWEEVIGNIQKNKEKSEIHLNKTLVAMLETVRYEDQHYRLQLDSIEKKYGFNSNELKTHWKMIKEKDSINLNKVTQILDNHGWLGADSIGQEGNTTLFLVIQHSNLKTQEKYLPMARAANKIGNIRSSSLALLEDRVALGQGKKQIYGSQIGQNPITHAYYISPLEDPDNVDQRRAKVGLPPMSEYVKNWDLEWNLEKYKNELPMLEEKLNRQK